jgi:hypothetical protein
MLEGECEFRENRGSISLTLPACVNELLPVISIFRDRFFAEFDIEGLRVTSSGSCEFRKNRYRKGRTLLKGVNEIAPILQFFVR